MSLFDLFTGIPLLAYLPPFIICMFYAFIVIRKMYREDMECTKCISIGTLLFGILLVAIAACPVINWLALASETVIMALVYQEEVVRFLDTPLCRFAFWKKKNPPKETL